MREGGGKLFRGDERMERTRGAVIPIFLSIYATMSNLSSVCRWRMGRVVSLVSLDTLYILAFLHLLAVDIVLTLRTLPLVPVNRPR